MGESATPPDEVPPLALQQQFWDDFNLSHLASADRSPLQLQQQEVAHAVVRRAVADLPEKRPLRILDLGCGTGWLGASLTPFGEVTGIDLSSAAVLHGQNQFPQLKLIAGDFSDTRLVGPYDVVVSSEVIAHVADQRAFVKRVAELLHPGGIFLLMSQNGFVWRRTSSLRPQGEGQIRNWPSLKTLRTLLVESGFDIERIGSMQPSGDRGVLRVVNSRWLRGGFKVLQLGDRWKAVLEHLRVGRELTIEARRRQP